MADTPTDPATNQEPVSNTPTQPNPTSNLNQPAPPQPVGPQPTPEFDNPPPPTPSIDPITSMEGTSTPTNEPPLPTGHEIFGQSSGAVPQPPDPTPPPPPVQNIEPPPMEASVTDTPNTAPVGPSQDQPDPVQSPDSNLVGEQTADPSSNPVDPTPTVPLASSTDTQSFGGDPVPSPDPAPEPASTSGYTPEPQQATSSPPISAEEVGPPWLRTDPNVRAAQDSSGTISGVAENPISGPTPQEGPMPWQAPSEEGNLPLSPEEGRGEGHFPVIIFVLLVLGIIFAIGIFLFSQGALPFGG